MNESGLTCFITIVEKGSFSAAAESLYLSQPALSQRIRTLENHLGFALFRHSTHRAELTEAGRAFYPKARQLIASYNIAVQEGQFIAQNVRTGQQRLRIGCLDEQIFTVWTVLFGLSAEIMADFSPLPMRFRSRAELYSALLHGEADLSFQMENGDIAAFGLCFLPVVRVSELCVSFFSNRPPLPASGIPLEELSSWRVAFHHSAGYTLYEDALRRELSGWQNTLSVLEPHDFFEAAFGIPTLLLVPRLTLASGLEGYAVPLKWGEGIAAGFVYAGDCDGRILDFAEWIRDTVAEKGNPWE